MKFKVWDKDENKFIQTRDKDAQEEYFTINSDGDLMQNFSVFGSQNEFSLDYAFNRFIPVFSTSKTDINGNELFTGDIRGANWWKYEICFGDYMIKNDDWNVTFDLTGFYIKYLDKHKGVDFFDVENLTDPHLGNKFENPELLEE